MSKIQRGSFGWGFLFWLLFQDLFRWNMRNSMLQMITPVVVENEINFLFSAVRTGKYCT